MKKETEEQISEFLRVSSAITGVMMGLGFLFMGLTKSMFPVSIFGMTSLFAGMLSASTLSKEKDEYDFEKITPKNIN